MRFCVKRGTEEAHKDAAFAAKVRRIVATGPDEVEIVADLPTEMFALRDGERFDATWWCKTTSAPPSVPTEADGEAIELEGVVYRVDNENRTAEASAGGLLMRIPIARSDDNDVIVEDERIIVRFARVD